MRLLCDFEKIFKKKPPNFTGFRFTSNQERNYISTEKNKKTLSGELDTRFAVNKHEFS